MNKKISTTFAVVVILLIAGFVGWISLCKNDKDDFSFEGKIGGENYGKKCTKHAYDGEAKIKAWYASTEENKVLGVSDEDIKKFPKGYEIKLVKLADNSFEMEKKLKKASKDNPAEITIKGVYFECGKTPLISFASGEKMFKEYLK